MLQKYPAFDYDSFQKAENFLRRQISFEIHANIFEAAVGLFFIKADMFFNFVGFYIFLDVFKESSQFQVLEMELIYIYWQQKRSLSPTEKTAKNAFKLVFLD